MLGTLMKYEFQSVARILLPLYGAWFIASILLGFSGDAASEFAAIVATGSAIFYVVIFVAAIVMTVIILIQRFYKNLLGNEGYCMFALPVSTGRHIFNKISSAAIWTVLGIIVACLTALVVAIVAEGPELFNDSWVFFDIAFSELKDFHVIITIVEVFLLALLTCGETAAKIYAAISIGHQIQNHRILGAFGAYIIIAILEGILASILAKIADMTGIFLVYGNLMKNLSGFALFQVDVLLFALAAGALMAIYWFITWYLLKNRLNLE